MRLPTAATDHAPGGFTWTRDGELVMVAFTCDRDREDPEGPDACGCGRAFAGLESHRATTLARIVEVPIDLGILRDIVHKTLARGGWVKGGDSISTTEMEMVADVAAEMVEIGEHFEVGDRLTRRLDDLYLV